jgi:hypothetical protein
VEVDRSKIDLLLYAAALGITAFSLPLIFLDGSKVYISIFLLTSSVLALHQIRKFGVFNPFSLFFITALPYLYASPIDIIFFENSTSLDAQIISIQCTYGMLFLVSALAFTKIKLKETKAIIVKRRFGFDPTNSILIALAVINAIFVASFFSLNIGALSRSEIYSQKPVTYDLFKLFSQCGIYFLLWQSMFINERPLRELRPALLAIASILILDILIVGDRRMAVVITLIILYYYTIRNRIPKTLWSIIFGMSVLLIAYGGVRNLPPSAWLDIYGNTNFGVFLNPMNLEFGAFSRIWIDIYSSNSLEIKPTYLQSISQIIPSALIPDRSLAPSLEYVKRFHPEIYAAGGGMAFNAILESIINFHFLGPIILGAVFGVAFSRHNSKSPIRILFFAVLIYSLCFTMRNDFTSTLRFLIISSSINIACLLIFNRIRAVRNQLV